MNPTKNLFSVEETPPTCTKNVERSQSFIYGICWTCCLCERYNATNMIAVKLLYKRKKDLQNTTQKTKNWATWTPLKTSGDLECSWQVNCSCSTCDTYAQFLVFCVVFCRSFFLLAFYCLVLWFTTFDYPFGIFKLFFLIPWQILPLWLKFQIFYDLVYNQLKCKWFKTPIVLLLTTWRATDIGTTNVKFRKTKTWKASTHNKGINIYISVVFIYMYIKK
jgi:hypothetical protein